MHFIVNERGFWKIQIILIPIVIIQIMTIGYVMQVSAENLSEEWAMEKTIWLFYSEKLTDEDRPKLKSLFDEVESYIVEDRNNPVLWFLHGRIYAIYLKFRVREIYDLGREQILNDRQYQEIKGKYFIDYEKALDLDILSDAPMHLNSLMLSTMTTHDMLVSADFKERALRHHLELEVVHENENFDFDVFTAMYNAYNDEHRYDKALNIIDEMIIKFSNQAENLNKLKGKIEAKRNTIKPKISSRHQEKQEQKQKHPSERKPDVQEEKKDIQPPPHQQEVITEATKAPVQKKGKTKPAVKAGQEPKPPITAQSDNTLLYILLATGGVIIFFAGVLALRKRKEKS